MDDIINLKNIEINNYFRTEIEQEQFLDPNIIIHIWPPSEAAFNEYFGLDKLKERRKWVNDHAVL